MKTQSHGLVKIEPIKSLFCVRPTRAVLLVGEQIMDKDRIEGSAKEIKGKIKEVAGKVLARIMRRFDRYAVNTTRSA